MPTRSCRESNRQRVKSWSSRGVGLGVCPAAGLRTGELKYGFALRSVNRYKLSSIGNAFWSQFKLEKAIIVCVF